MCSVSSVQELKCIKEDDLKDMGLKNKGEKYRL